MHSLPVIRTGRSGVPSTCARYEQRATSLRAGIDSRWPFRQRDQTVSLRRHQQTTAGHEHGRDDTTLRAAELLHVTVRRRRVVPDTRPTVAINVHTKATINR